MKEDSAAAVIKDLKSLANAQNAVNLARFFKTGKGQYGYGDKFLGIKVPEQRKVVRAHAKLAITEAAKLLHSEWHEVRLVGLLILVHQYQRADATIRRRIFDLYLASTRHINNWDLVDLSAEHIVGPHVPPKDLAVLERLARSPDVWERRIAMLATFHWIKLREFAPALRVAELLLDDKHDLIHKAVGWMLREIGKRDRAAEVEFLAEHYREMPRTALRYAIEHFSEGERRSYMTGTAHGAR